MYFISDIKKMLSSRIVQITFIFLLVTMLADPISVLIHARRYTGFFENIGANPFQFWLLMNSASWGNNAAHPRWRDKMLWSNSVACSRLYFFETVVFTIGFICIFI